MLLHFILFLLFHLRPYRSPFIWHSVWSSVTFYSCLAESTIGLKEASRRCLFMLLEFDRWVCELRNNFLIILNKKVKRLYMKFFITSIASWWSLIGMAAFEKGWFFFFWGWSMMSGWASVSIELSTENWESTVLWRGSSAWIHVFPTQTPTDQHAFTNRSTCQQVFLLQQNVQKGLFSFEYWSKLRKPPPKTVKS